MVTNDFINAFDYYNRANQRLQSHLQKHMNATLDEAENRLYSDLDNAKAAFEKVFTDYVDERINSILASKGVGD